MRRQIQLLPDSGPCRLRHITHGAATVPGAVQVDGVWLVPQPARGVNGRAGWQMASYDRRLGEPGTMSVTLPNGPGGDGVLHRDRFRYFTDANYHAGDEWLEVYRNDHTLLFVGTPVSGRLSRGQVELQLADALEVLNQTREFAAGFWAHAPRDVFEHYCRRWQPRTADDFTTTGRFDFDSTTDHVTSDGRWRFIAADEDPEHPGAAWLRPTRTQPGEIHWNGAPVTHNALAAWRAETVVRIGGGAYSETGWTLTFALTDPAGPTIYRIRRTPTQMICDAEGPSGANTQVVRQETDREAPITLAIEKRHRWAYFYVDGQLRAVLPARTDPADLELVVTLDAPVTDAAAYVELAIARQAVSLVQRSGIGGDLSLPGLPARDDGLQGEYFDDHDIARDDPSGAADRVLNPTRQPYARRIDRQITFTAADWQPSTPANSEHFSARWTGSVYLDLDNFDYALRVDMEDRARIWIGRTRAGEELLTDWPSAGHTGNVTTTGPWLKAGSPGTSAPSGDAGPLAGQRSGWYPIVIEFSTGAGANRIRVDYARSDAPGSWDGLGAVPSTLRLSPLGVHKAQVRYDSHLEQLKQVAASYGYQFTCEPRQLESGEFPGRCVPVARVGRDTAKVIDGLEGVEPVAESTAEEVIDSLLADAAGLADEGGAQLTHEEINFDALDEPRFALLAAYESLADITFPRLLEQRAHSLLALRARPWEEVSVRVPGRRELVDSFPLTGLPANIREFAWLPGDGLRLDLPEIRVHDTEPRQIAGVSWPVRPAGLGVPSLSFRQRPRSLRQQLRDVARVAVQGDRNYQGQLVAASGNVAGNAASGLSDAYSRANVPANLADVVKAELVVQHKTDTSAMTVEINGAATSIAVTAPDRIDVTRYLARAGTDPRIYARLTGGTGEASYQLELRVRV